jgi:hypothetical protein
MNLSQHSVFSFTNVPENSSLSSLHSDKFIVDKELLLGTNVKDKIKLYTLVTDYIIKLDVILSDNTIKNYPVIVPNNLIIDVELMENDKVIDLRVILGDEVVICPVIFSKKIVIDFIEGYEKTKRKSIFNIEDDVKNKKLKKSIDKLFLEVSNEKINLSKDNLDKELLCETNVKEHTLCSGTNVKENTMNLSELSKDKEPFSVAYEKENTMNLSERSKEPFSVAYEKENTLYYQVIPQVSPNLENNNFLSNERILMDNNRRMNIEGFEINMTNNLIKYINSLYYEFDSLYINLTDKEYYGINNYVKYYFKLNKLNNEFDYITPNLRKMGQLFS